MGEVGAYTRSKGATIAEGAKNNGVDGTSRAFGAGDGGSAGWWPHVGQGANDNGNVGGNGGSPGGGGGGGSGAYAGSGANGGIGARGEVRIWAW